MNINIHQYSTTVIFYYDLNQVKLDGHFENQNHLSRSQTLITLITSYSFSIAREKHIQSHEKKKKTTALKMHIQRHQNGITHSSKIKTDTYLLQHNHFKNPSSNQIESSIITPQSPLRKHCNDCVVSGGPRPDIKIHLPRRIVPFPPLPHPLPLHHRLRIRFLVPRRQIKLFCFSRNPVPCRSTS